jgi:putative transcriptional regulator
MTAKHHPSDATLASYAAGILDEARGLVVATHLTLCAQCREAVHGFEQVGGAMLGEAEPAAMSPGALQRAMAALGPLDIVAPAPAPAMIGGEGGAHDVPAPLSRYAMGPWRWIGRGVQWRSVDVASDDGVRVFMLKAAPGTKLPRHRHTGTEWTCVFDGAFSHQFGRYGAGDFDEADESVEHDPVVDAMMGCVCLVALQGNIELQGFFGRLLQPFVRI